MITFVINEPPMGAVRMTQRSKWTSKSAQRYLSYKQMIGFVARKQFLEPLEGPVAVEVGFRYPFPKSWTKKRLKEALESQELPTIKPDIDNCVKGIFDALNKIAWNDDSQVVALVTRKYYSDHPEIEVKVWQIGEETQEII
ncbi:RusA family crossover junction endodeoxyribonuclease [Paenibacillus sp. EKM102P]|uniref:RusA family crossover junction endodeoxyribonuclease n=1 Tax=unclassified Paenibacillus TaxID=185978 RepID=UPI00142E0755|nr:MULTISPECIES: RusA family crossover junction endodeoxyribonuclease [unclassified Paenibacillus]KAF6618291.1 RusA family crossover junction endodeoxyribonuclease [Paenibacillus sp. EKM101P]KAF6624636.1 RusA family crossover junction endodeoxyribonuclease [Paenibacillus sp. EKM102P]KAF6635585.1 RusA family crossover junction endodeoxyribonuclease [Paenibacillus sp. EKM10P]KAF6648705.1 RusA family crossover junction endodeoxyribonuclease [Paenibacillus sp. EKM11P]